MFKYLFAILFIAGISYAGYLYIMDQHLNFDRASLKHSQRHEAPHLMYQQNQLQQLQAQAKDGHMHLTIETFNQLDEITINKPGDQPLSFTVPLQTQHITPPVSYVMPDKLLAISDVEGNFNTVTQLLKSHGVLDEQLNWLYGQNQLMIIGDVFDRGNHVTELLWLLYRLEAQAQNAGGRVHLLLGNHEIMNLQNDLRYLEAKYLQFDQLLAEQTPWRYVDLFGPHSELGRWLRSKNIVEKIGDTLFTHGGLSPAIAQAGYSLEQINQQMRQHIDIKKADRNAQQQLLFGRSGPLWYRGYFMSLQDNEIITAEQLKQVLTHFEAKAIAVGHTIVDKPATLFNAQVIAVDVKHPADHLLTIPPRQSYGVLFAAGKRFVVDGDGGVELMVDY